MTWGRDKAVNGSAAMISIYEYSHIEDELELVIYSKNKIQIKFNHKGEILK